MKTAFTTASLVLFSFAMTFSQAGSIDESFGTSGIVTASFYADEHAYGRRILTLNSGRILVTGNTNTPDDGSMVVLLCYLEDGTPDPDFGNEGKVFVPFPGLRSYVEKTVLQPDGKIVLVTNLEGGGEESQYAIYRLHPDGAADMSFGVDGKVVYGIPGASQSMGELVLQPDGKILIAGEFWHDGDTADQYFVARYLQNGMPDLGFGNNGIVFQRVGNYYSGIHSMLLQPDGKIIVAGYAVYDDQENITAVRFNSDGSLDHSFSEDGILRISFDFYPCVAYCGLLQPDGKIVLAGYVDYVIQKSDPIVVRINPDGTLDNSFHSDGILTIPLTPHSDRVRSVALQPDGKLLIGGSAHNGINGGGDMTIMRVNPDGSMDAAFGENGVVIYPVAPANSDELTALALQQDGKIVATGSFRDDLVSKIFTARFLSGLSTGVSEVSRPINTVTMYPNPASEDIHVQYTLHQSDILSVTLMDISGNPVKELMSQLHHEPGSYLHTFPLPTWLPSGSYLLTLQGRNSVQGIPVTIKH